MWRMIATMVPAFSVLSVVYPREERNSSTEPSVVPIGSFSWIIAWMGLSCGSSTSGICDLQPANKLSTAVNKSRGTRGYFGWCWRRELIHQCLFDDLEAILFDHRVRKDFLRDALQLLLRLVVIPAVEV